MRSIDVWGCEEDIDWVGTFEKNGNNLTINDGEETRTAKIVELTSSLLSLEIEGDENGDGTTERYIIRFDR